ncbi:hypothetical protein V2S66_24215 [Streptomyces sp. V4-01]|uniref:Uncharacterized protein n=1 Tax=Actinacidiphila polyblastidii TaxID=3110430 RepID=A0ABU7PID0_9ACTN|nr:hypothetical protein [Streptomyces sp. V4-01]
MGSGATSAGDDLTAGRTNSSEERTIVVATTAENGYADDFVVYVGTKDGKVLRTVADGVDGIHATGSVEFDTGGAVGVLPAGNGLVGTGLNGVVGYVHAALRDKQEEQTRQAGVFGSGGASAGVFGRGAAGVVGYSGPTPRDTAWEADGHAGVRGRSDDIGVRGKGDSGGVQGRSELSFGVEGVGATGVLGRSTDGVGVYASCTSGPGFQATSGTDNAAVFEAPKRAQLWLVPPEVAPPSGPEVAITPKGFHQIDGESTNPLRKNGRAGELAAIKDARGRTTLWFCVDDAVSPSRWAQVLLGPAFSGAADDS